MGVTFQALERLQEMNLLPPHAHVLDIGSSNLYSATPAGLRQFLSSYGSTEREDTDEFVARLAAGSKYGPDGVANESFLGELLERAGLRYISFDVASGYNTQVFDLNRNALEEGQRGAFDTVINFGTTEHVLNQLNAFRVIHDATKPGGHMVHSLPCVGYVDHGFFAYTPRMFFDLASCNGYELIRFEYQGPTKGKELLPIVRDYRPYFPRLSATIDKAHNTDLASFVAPDIGAFVVFRKKKDAGFNIPMELSTSVGQVTLADPNAAPGAAAAMSTKQLYRFAFGFLRAAIWRTPNAVARKAGRGLKRLFRRT
jgi:SAM-dependent methyltransferase